jgi:hypothetical protein
VADEHSLVVPRTAFVVEPELETFTSERWEIDSYPQIVELAENYDAFDRPVGAVK